VDEAKEREGKGVENEGASEVVVVVVVV